MSQPDHSKFLNQRYFSSLDALRFISIVAVVWHHTAPRWEALPASARGFLGVDMFFVISGFLIVTLLLRERKGSGEISLKSFYMRRSLRIFPLYYALILGIGAGFLFLKPDSQHASKFFSDFPYLVTYTSNWVHLEWVFLGLTWSLATEEQFYLLWPPLEKYLRKLALPLLLGFLVLNQLINFKYLESPLAALIGPDFRSLEIVQITFTPICLGVLLAHLLDRPEGFRWVALLTGHRIATPVLLAATLGLASIPGDIAGWPRLLVHVAMTLLLASCVVRDDHGLVKAFHWRAVRRIGILCYGIYLFHNLAKYGVAQVLGKLGLEDPVVEGLLEFVLTLAVVIPMAELSFRFFEMPFLKLKARFSQKQSEKPPAVTA